MIDAANILKNSVKDVPANNCELLNIQGLFISYGLEQRLQILVVTGKLQVLGSSHSICNRVSGYSRVNLFQTYPNSQIYRIWILFAHLVSTVSADIVALT